MSAAICSTLFYITAELKADIMLSEELHANAMVCVMTSYLENIMFIFLYAG
jgi:hypothetical protein